MDELGEEIAKKMTKLEELLAKAEEAEAPFQAKLKEHVTRIDRVVEMVDNLITGGINNDERSEGEGGSRQTQTTFCTGAITDSGEI